MRILTWEPKERHGVWTALAAAGLLTGAAMAVFGLPPADVHGPLHHMGIMMPTCGGTRALRLTMLGQWGAAWTYNPMSVILAVGAGLTLVRALAGVASGRWLTVRLRLPRWTWIVLIATGALAMVFLQIRQQGIADLLMGP